MTKLLAMACVAGASLVLAGGWPAVVDAQPTRPAVTVSPSSIAPTAQYFTTTHKLAGSGSVVTVRVGPNKVLVPSFPVEVMECDPYPSSQSDCDMETTLPFDQLTKKRDLAAANGSVTFHFLLWAPLPNKWDPVPVIKVGPGHPTALWIGDDPSNWASTGLVSSPVAIRSNSGESSRSAAANRPGHATAAVFDQSARPSRGSGTLAVVLVAVVAVLVAAGGGIVATGGRRRRRPARS